MQVTDEMVRVARETFDNVSGSPLELATNDAWREALEAALAVDGVALQGWRPIESAPKDRPLLLAAYIVPSDEAQRNGSRPIWHIETGRAFGTKLDRWTNVLGQQPSHWQPLPPPPAASDREERR